MTWNRFAAGLLELQTWTFLTFGVLSNFITAHIWGVSPTTDTSNHFGYSGLLFKSVHDHHSTWVKPGWSTAEFYNIHNWGIFRQYFQLKDSHVVIMISRTKLNRYYRYLENICWTCAWWMLHCVAKKRIQFQCLMSKFLKWISKWTIEGKFSYYLLHSIYYTLLHNEYGYMWQISYIRTLMLSAIIMFKVWNWQAGQFYEWALSRLCQLKIAKSCKNACLEFSF